MKFITKPFLLQKGSQQALHNLASKFWVVPTADKINGKWVHCNSQNYVHSVTLRQHQITVLSAEMKPPPRRNTEEQHPFSLLILQTRQQIPSGKGREECSTGFNVSLWRRFLLANPTQYETKEKKNIEKTKKKPTRRATCLNSRINLPYSLK